MVKTVVIDAGHGGHDAGATGNGLKEKDLTLAIALETEKILKRDYNGAKVVQTRRTDKYLTLKQRSDVSNSHKTDLFVSVHINSAKNNTAHGYESYISPYTSHKKALRTIHNEVAGYFKRNNIHDRGLKELAFYVLRWTHAPAILTESLFINNPKEAKFLKGNINQIANAHAAGIAKMLGLQKKAQQVNEEDAQMKQEIAALKKEVANLRKLVGKGQAGKTLAKYVERGKELGITDGANAGHPITREQAIAMMVRLYDLLK